MINSGVPRGLRPDARALAEQLGVSASAVGNYETGVSFPKEDVLLRLFDALRTDPNQLFCGSYRSGGFDLSGAERTLLKNTARLLPSDATPCAA